MRVCGCVMVVGWVQGWLGRRVVWQSSHPLPVASLEAHCPYSVRCGGVGMCERCVCGVEFSYCITSGKQHTVHSTCMYIVQ